MCNGMVFFFLIDLEVQAFFVLDFFRTGDTSLSLRFAGVVLTISYEFPFFAVFFFLFCYVWFMFFSFLSTHLTKRTSCIWSWVTSGFLFLLYANAKKKRRMVHR